MHAVGEFFLALGEGLGRQLLFGFGLLVVLGVLAFHWSSSVSRESTTRGQLAPPSLRLARGLTTVGYY